MKQIDECLDRAFAGKKALSKKLRAAIIDCNSERMLFLCHYQHLVLIYNLNKKELERQWYELPADKRGLDAALKYIKNREEENNG